MHYAANMGNLDLAKLLLSRGSDVDARNEVSFYETLSEVLQLVI